MRTIFGLRRRLHSSALPPIAPLARARHAIFQLLLRPGLRLAPKPESPVRLRKRFRLSPVAASSAFASGQLPAFAGSLIIQFYRPTNPRLAPGAVSSGSAG